MNWKGGVHFLILTIPRAILSLERFGKFPSGITEWSSSFFLQASGVQQSLVVSTQLVCAEICFPISRLIKCLHDFSTTPFPIFKDTFQPHLEPFP